MVTMLKRKKKKHFFLSIDNIIKVIISIIRPELNGEMDEIPHKTTTTKQKKKNFFLFVKLP